MPWRGTHSASAWYEQVYPGVDHTAGAPSAGMNDMMELDGALPVGLSDAPFASAGPAPALPAGTVRQLTSARPRP